MTKYFSLKHHSGFLIFAILCLTLSPKLNAQQSNKYQQKIKEIVKEKLKIDFNTLQQISKTHQFPTSTLASKSKPIKNTNQKKQQQNEEAVISDDPIAESEVHAAINPLDDKNIIVSPIFSDGSNPLLPTLLCPVYYTKDFGITWQKSNFVTQPDDPNGFVAGGGDPVLAFDDKGFAYLTWLYLYFDANFATKMGLFAAKSTDGGETWTNLNPITVGNLDVFTGEGQLVDKQWLAVDRTSTSENYNTLYVAFYEVDSNNGINQISVRKKNGNSDNFSTSSVKVNTTNFSDLQFASIDCDGLGGVHVSFFAMDDNQQWALYHAVSWDGAQTFEPEVKISNAVVPGMLGGAGAPPIGISTDRMYPCPHIKADKSNSPFKNNIYATWTALGTTSNSTEGTDIYFSKSTDGGATWTPAKILNNDPNPDTEQFYSSIDVNEDGTIVVTFYDRREDTNNKLTHYYIAYSTDGGETFTNQFPVSTNPTDFATVGSQNAEFGIGEYTQVISTKNFAIPIWTDGRENNGDLNIYAGFVPLDGSTNTITFTSLSTNFSVSNPTPNPATNNCSVTINLGKPSKLSAKLYSIDGKLIQTITNKTFAEGKHTLSLPLSKVKKGNYLLYFESIFGITARQIIIE